MADSIESLSTIYKQLNILFCDIDIYMDITGNPITGQDLAPSDTPTFNGAVLTGELDMQNNKIINTADPTNPQDVATKTYVDTAVGGGFDQSLNTTDNVSFADVNITNSSRTLVIPKFDNTGNFVSSDLKIEETKTEDIYSLENTDPVFRIRNTGVGNARLEFISGVAQFGELSYNSVTGLNLELNGQGSLKFQPTGEITINNNLDILSNDITNIGTGPGAFPSLFTTLTTLSNDKVSKAGDEMTGSLELGYTAPQLKLKDTSAVLGATGSILYQDSNEDNYAIVTATKSIGGSLKLGYGTGGAELNISDNNDIYPSISGGDLGRSGNRWDTYNGINVNLEDENPSIIINGTGGGAPSSKIGLQIGGVEGASIELNSLSNLKIKTVSNLLQFENDGELINMNDGGYLYPQNAVQDLGLIANRWRDLYIQNINMTGSIVGQVKPYGEFYMQNNATETILTVPTTPVKVAGTTITGQNNQFIHTTNRLQYTGTETKIFKLNASFSWELSSGVADLASMYIYKNGVVITKSRLQGKMNDTLANYPRNASITILESLSTNDYVELWVSNDGNTNNMIVSYIQFNITEV
jgi:hypothetical protein